MDIKKWLEKNSGLLIILGTLLIYIITKTLLPGQGWVDLVGGAIIFFEIIALVGMEVTEGAKKHGWKNEIIDTLMAIAIALFLWFGAQFLLNTNTPISSVVSCSMLNELQRGDFVIVQGGEIKAPEIELTKAEFERMVKGPFTVNRNGVEYTFDKPFNTYCYYHKNEDICHDYFTSNDEFVEQAGVANYHYKVCDVKYINRYETAKMRCLSYVEIKGQKFQIANKNADVIVYTPRPTDLYSAVGDIVHRAVAKIKVGNETYYLTAGDNNPVLDSQVYDFASGIGNYPPSSENVKGKVIAKVPYLGYLKLFIVGYWKEDEQCLWNLKR